MQRVEPAGHLQTQTDWRPLLEPCAPCHDHRPGLVHALPKNCTCMLDVSHDKRYGRLALKDYSSVDYVLACGSPVHVPCCGRAETGHLSCQCFYERNADVSRNCGFLPNRR